MIKAIIFDAGGVIVESSALIDLFLSIFKPKNKEEFIKQVNLQAIPLCKGEMSEKDYWKEIGKVVELNNNFPEDLWTTQYEKFTHLDKEVLNLIINLRKHYKTALISNTIEPHRIINEKRGLFKPFDVVILSHQVKMAKDNSDIFLLAVNKLNVKPEECIFIDDIQKFVDTAESFGMKGILFKSAEQLKKDLLKLGVKI